MVGEGLIDEKKAVTRVEPQALVQLLAPVFDTKAKGEALAGGRSLTRGLAAGPGAACGRVVFSPEKAVDMVHNKREKVILVRTETSPEDIEGMSVAEGILTARGGMTSHAAVVARGMGKPCVVGAHEISVDYDRKLFRAGKETVEQGEWISIDGTTGEVIRGQLPTHPSEIVQVLIDKTIKPETSELYQRYEKLMGWADRHRRLKVRTNADTPEDAWAARALGAEGIGLCRTEHMFFHADRIRAVRETILAETTREREAALAKVLPFQRQDFVDIFRVMKGLPVTVRLLDPPLHEFLPDDPDLIAELAQLKGTSAEKVRERVAALHEANPMLGHRGCRLGVTFPEIYDTQVRAIFEAAVEVVGEGIAVQPEIMLPIVGTVNEMKILRDRVVAIGSEILGRRNLKLPYLVGTMIEVPRAALIAGSLAREAEFFSFGTNDLTQMTFAYSRDDAERSFLGHYVMNGVLPSDPFQTLDIEGVGELVKIATQRGRGTNPKLKIGICGEHGGDPASIHFFHAIGLDYVSCSPRRVPVARLAAAQAALGAATGEATGKL
jgi:pyruvate,orthophosphate dikinase